MQETQGLRTYTGYQQMLDQAQYNLHKKYPGVSVQATTPEEKAKKIVGYILKSNGDRIPITVQESNQY